MKRSCSSYALLSCLALLAAPAAASSGEPTWGAAWQCVPFARQMSGVNIHGDAWTWWDQAKDVYARGQRPRVGAVLVFRPNGAMRLGHVSVVSQVIDRRVIMVTHANWSRIGGVRGQVERDVTVFDVSPGNDWSQVKVWYRDNDGLGSTSYPTYGFIYGTPDRSDGGGLRVAKASPDLSGPSPDIVASLIDTLR